MNESDRDVAALAAEQFGVFARKQAAAEGLSEEAMSRRVMTGRWEVRERQPCRWAIRFWVSGQHPQRDSAERVARVRES